MTNKARIFNSYSTKDGKPCADALREELEAKGFSVWQDLVALKGGQDWWSQIEAALKSKELQHFILVVTPGALDSAVVRREIRLARQEGKTVSPMRGPGFDNLNELPRWIGQIYDLKIPEKHDLLMHVLAGPSYQNRVPMMAPEPPVDFVQRPVEFEALKRKLLDAKGDAVAITAALRGAGGYGKTTLAKALAHDADIEDAYFDGILWAELGEKPENLLSIISDLITRLTGAPPGLATVNAAASALAEALGDRRIFLVIDDAWREQDLRPFLQGGRNTTRLITTRRDDILPQKAEREHVDAMAANEALALLSWGLPEDQATTEKPSLAALGQRLGEWAQLLKLVNGFLCDRVVTNHEPLHRAIAGVNKRLDLKGFTAFDAKNAASRANAIAKTIGVSLDLLSESERARFAELAVFPEDVDVPLGVVSRLWSDTGKLDEIDTEDLLRRLQSLSLLLSLDLDRRTLRFHDTVRHFLQEQAGEGGLIALHKALLDSMDGPEADADEASRRYYYLHRPAHLEVAREHLALDALLENPAWLQAKLDALDSPQALVADYEQFGQTLLHYMIHHTLQLTSGICARDKRQLLPQLHGRLMAQNPASRFCVAARKLVVPPAILTCRASLTPPGAEIARLEGHGGWVNALAMLPDGRLASGSSHTTIRLWDVKTGAETAKLEGHDVSVNALAVLPDGRLASGSMTTPSGSGTSKPEPRRPSSKAMAVRFGRLRCCPTAASPRAPMTTLSGSGTPQSEPRWPGSRAMAVRSMRSPCCPTAASPRNFMTTPYGSGMSKVEPRRPELEGHTGWVRALALLPDGCLISSGDNTIRLWDVKTGAETARLEGHGGPVRALAVLPDGRLASSGDNTIRLWDVKTGAETARLEDHGGPVWAFALLPDDRLASGSHDNTIRLWDAKTGAEMARLEGHGGSVRALALLPDGRLASGSDDKAIRLWDVRTGAETARLEGHSGPVYALARLADDRLASGSHDNTIRLWDAKTGAETARLEGHGEVSALAVLPDGRLASGSSFFDTTIKLWDVKTGAEMARLEGHGGSVRALALLPDGRLASGSDDKTIRLWDVKTGAETARLEGHHGLIWTLMLLPDGRLASGSWDNTIRLWDAKTGQQLVRLEVDFAVTSLATLRGNRLAAGDYGGRIHWLEILD